MATSADLPFPDLSLWASRRAASRRVPTAHDVAEVTPWCLCRLLLQITSQKWPSCSEKLVCGLKLIHMPDTTHALTIQQLQVDVKLLQACESATAVYFRGVYYVPLCIVTPRRHSQQLSRLVRVSCDCVLCCGVVRFAEDGLCLTNGCAAGERRWWALWSQQTKCGRRNSPHQAKAGRGPQL